MNLTKSQEAASMHKDGPALVLAVPGAGKTTVLLQRIDNLVNIHGVNPKNILSITFSKAQAMDMEKRFKNKYPSNAHFATIHAFAYDIIRAYAKENKRQIDLIEGKAGFNKYGLIKRLYYSLNSTFIKDDTLEEFFTAYSFIKNSMISPTTYMEDYKPKIKNFKNLICQYESFKKERHLIDFDDMLTLALEILEREEKILRRIRNRFKYIQVDEAQDTSKIQIQIIRKIAQPLDNLFIVADDDQSIYGFRGASPKDLLAFPKAYPQAQVFFMEENFRSYEDITGTANIFIKKNKNRYNKTIISTKGKKEPVKVITCNNIKAQYDYLVDRIREDLDQAKTVGVLYRNNISGLGLMDSLKEADLPYFNRDHSKAYLAHFVIEDMVNILKLAHDPSDVGLYEQVYYKLNAYLKKSYLPYLRNLPGSMTVFDGLLDIPGLKDYQKEKIIDLAYDFRTVKELDLPKAISYIEKQIGYGTYLEDKTKKSGNEGYSPDLVLESLKYISRGLTSPYDLEEKLLLIRNEQSQMGQPLSLTTVHSSKGLEFDRVYLIDLVEGEFPSHKSQELSPKGRAEALEEERRLFYVAMTRAREGLSLFTLKFRNHKRVSPSSFFMDIKNIK